MSTLFDGIFSGPGGIATWLIDDFAGTDADFAYLSGGIYDPKTMSSAGEVQIDYTIKITPPSPWVQNEVDGNTHERGEMSFMISQVAVEDYGQPPIGSSVTFNDTEWRIVDVEPCRSGDEMAAYRIIVGKK